jgi:alpha-D-ribose 1-methylphosphonate 5-triphosphate synthase subunit PhnG
MTDQIAAQDRKRWLSLLATADEGQLAQLWQDSGRAPAFRWLRTPEAGGVMVRGRAGGTGAPFNLGEMTVTRCSLALENGTVGHGYVQGRSRAKAEIAAKVDALMQTDCSEDLRAQILNPLADAQHKARTTRAAKAAATKVEFFTLVRGED